MFSYTIDVGEVGGCRFDGKSVLRMLACSFGLFVELASSVE